MLAGIIRWAMDMGKYVNGCLGDSEGEGEGERVSVRWG